MSSPPFAFPHPGPPPERPELPEGATPPPAPGPGWPAWSAPLALIGGLGMALVGAIVLSPVQLLLGYDDLSNPPFGFEIGLNVVQDLAFIAAAVVFARMTRPPRPADFGLVPTRWGRAFKLVVITYAGFFLFTIAWSVVLGINEKDDLAQQLGVGDSPVRIAVFALLVCVMAPIAEEILFRGYFFTALRSSMSLPVAAVVTGIVFGGIHAVSSPLAFIVPLMVFGAGLCLLYNATGSLYPCIALHALNNSIAVGATEGWGWQIPLVAAGAIALCLAITLPFADRGAPAAAAPA
jgi:membrane protease YdiL (CAAX protease family)